MPVASFDNEGYTRLTTKYNGSSHKTFMTTRLHPSRNTVPLRYVRSLLKFADAQGYRIDDIVANLPRDPRVGDENFMVDAVYYTQVYSKILWLLQDESFGMHLKQRTPAGSFRMMCLCIIHCETLGHALKRATEFTDFTRTLTGNQPLFTNPVKILNDGRAEYHFPHYQELIETEDYNTAYYMAHCMASWRRFWSWLIGKSVELLEVHLEQGASADSKYIEQLFGCKTVLNSDSNRFVFADHYLDCPLVHTEDSLKQFLKRAPYHLLVHTDEEDTSLIAQMKRYIGNDLSQEFPSVVDMAQHLNMSVRTLRRRLKEQDTTYQQFKDNLRREQAMRWLNQPELKINAVSALLGFDEPSAFHRSFKKWPGMTPGEYRNSRHAPKPDTDEAKAS